MSSTQNKLENIDNKENEVHKNTSPFAENSFSLQNGMVIEGTIGEGSNSRPIRAVVVTVNDIEIVVWPIDSSTTQTQMTVLPRSTTTYRIVRAARPEEIGQAISGMNSLQANWSSAMNIPPVFKAENSTEVIDAPISPTFSQTEKDGITKIVWR